MLRNYGQRTKHDYAMIGYNSRLDTLQAAILAVKLSYLERGNERRRAIAAKYCDLLQDAEIIVPSERPNTTHVYHLFVLQHSRRNELMAHLHEAGVQCGIHYPEPIHRIKTFESVRCVPEGAPVSTRLAKRILSLPMYPELTDTAVLRVSEAVIAFSNQP
jgi:dTDP-4-amino-4,6-dideoxygalactose transaminase